MFDVGFWELALLGIVALLIIGPERLPEAARVAGLWVGRARRMLREVKSDINRELREHDTAGLGTLKDEVQNAGARFQRATEQARDSVGADGIGDSLRDTFKDASPLAKDDADNNDADTGKPAIGAGYYYIYEYLQSKPRKAVLHTGACGYCNSGQGRGRRNDSSYKNSRWHGPYPSAEAARREQRALDVETRKECGCIARAAQTPTPGAPL